MKVSMVGLMVLLVVSAFAGGYELGHSNVNIQQVFKHALSNDINIGLTVTATHANGTVFATRYLPHDLIVDNFNKILTQVFSAGSNSPYGGLTVISNTGQGFCSLTGSLRYGAMMEIGTSSTAPARTDTALTAPYTPTGGNVGFVDNAQNAVACSSNCVPSVVTVGSTDSISGISGSQVITSSVTIQEAGLFIEGCNALNNAAYMLAHDTFTGIAVVNGDTVTVTYEIDLNNAGFTNNVAYFIANLLTGNIATGGTTIALVLTTTAGTTNNFYIWCSQNGGGGNGNPSLWIQTSKTNCIGTGAAAIGEMAIGTGSSAFTPSSTSLTSMVGAYTSIGITLYNSPTSYFTTTQTIGSSNTITEAGIFSSLAGNQYMWFALTFTGQSQSSGVPFGTTVRWSD